MAQRKAPPNASSLLSTLEMSLSLQGQAVLRAFCAQAIQRGAPLYLVGGSVRDLLLGIPPKELDMVAEGDAAGLALAVSRDLEARLVSHPRFGTATIKLNGERHDVAAARRESYPRPGALPRVSPSIIQDDLHRRDFTINAIAVPLTGPDRGRLLDPHQGRSDLEDSLVRVLHSNSFVDDPTRILRAVRYEQRLGLHIENETLGLLSQAVAEGRLESVGADRIRRELSLMLSESHPHRPLARAGELGLLQSIYPGLGNGPAVGQMSCAGEPDPLVYLAALAYPLTAKEGESFIHRLNMPIQWARAVRDTIAVRQLEAQLSRAGCQPSQVVQLLEGQATAALQAMQVLSTGDATRERVGLYLTHWRYVKPSLNGSQLVALGVPSGPMVGSIPPGAATGPAGRQSSQQARGDSYGKAISGPRYRGFDPRWMTNGASCAAKCWMATTRPPVRCAVAGSTSPGAPTPMCPSAVASPAMRRPWPSSSCAWTAPTVCKGSRTLAPPIPLSSHFVTLSEAKGLVRLGKHLRDGD